MTKQQYRMGQGYKIALVHYQKQKTRFLESLNLISLEEANRANQVLFSEIEISDQGEEAVNQIISRINNIIIRNPEMRSVRAEIAQIYKDKKISKEQANQQIQQMLAKIYNAQWIRQHVLSRLGNLGNIKINKIDDNALLGKIRMLLNMAFRHEVLNPGEQSKKQLEGILYEHAVVDGLQKYFSNKPEFDNIVKIEGIGASGGKGDIKISLDISQFSGSIQGKTNIREFQMQIKNMDLDRFLNSTKHSEKLNVGSNKELYNEAIAAGYRTPELAMYFLSKGDNVKRAIGQENTIYGYGGGKFLFTADLIESLHYKRRCSLTFPNVASKNFSAYIAWMKQK